MPTLYGYDADQEEAEGEFGTCGVGVSSLADMEVLLDGLPLDRVSTSMTINSPAAPIWAMYIVAAEKAGYPRSTLEGTTFSRSSSPRRSSCSRPSPRCAW
jgi:methylmalonyl-CoA mutase N-terminal domain/subunit